MNIFRSVLQSCFDNHPLQRNSRALSVMRFLPGGPPRNPSPPSRSFSPYPARVSSCLLSLCLSPLCASHPPDLKYIDTLTHTRMNEQPHTRGQVSHPPRTRLTYTYNTEYYHTNETAPILLFPHSSTLYILSLFFYSL